ncbi:MAG: ABC transporter permease subunit [Eubacteriales bacterium]|nr:ABC transporter permease subunit [Eubacteriales bacterium]
MDIERRAHQTWKETGKLFLHQWRHQLMIIPAMISFLIFSYIPLSGLVNSVLDYQLTDGFYGHAFAGITYFKQLFSDSDFFLAMKNTLGMSAIKFPFTFVCPIFLALTLNELSSLRLKKLTQTGSYLPHFLSYVIVATLWMIFLDRRGPINQVLASMHLINQPVEFLAESRLFWGVCTFIDCWQETGWNAIIYLAAISGIDQEIYEAAAVDGAGRVQRILHVTLPSIGWTIGVLFIMNIGNLLSGGPVGSNFNQSFLLGNSFNHSTSYVIQNFVVTTGLNQLRFSFASAANLIISTLSVALLLTANHVSKKRFGKSVF